MCTWRGNRRSELGKERRGSNSPRVKKFNRPDLNKIRSTRSWRTMSTIFLDLEAPKTFRLDEKKKKRESLPQFSVDSGRREIVRLRRGTDRVTGSWSDTDKIQFAYLEDIVGPPIDADRLPSILRQSESGTLRSSRRNSRPMVCAQYAAPIYRYQPRKSTMFPRFCAS